MPFIVSIVGYKNSGKTRLWSKDDPLIKIPGLFRRGDQAHGPPFRPGPTRQRYPDISGSGAEGVALIGDGHFSFLGKIDQEQGESVALTTQTFFPEVDLSLVEGFKNRSSSQDPFVTAGKEEEALLQKTEGVLVASVGEALIREKLPHFKRRSRRIGPDAWRSAI